MLKPIKSKLLSKYLILSLCISSSFIHSYDETHYVRNGLIIAGISVAAYCSGYLEKIKRTKGHQVQKATGDVSIVVPGSLRWEVLSRISQGSLVISGILASVSTFVEIHHYKKWLYMPDSFRRQQRFFFSCLLSGLCYTTAAISYNVKKGADYKIKTFKEEYIQANPEAYKEQLLKNKDFVIAQNEIQNF